MELEVYCTLTENRFNKHTSYKLVFLNGALKFQGKFNAIFAGLHYYTKSSDKRKQLSVPEEELILY